MSLPNSGSTTPRKASNTASCVQLLIEFKVRAWGPKTTFKVHHCIVFNPHSFRFELWPWTVRRKVNGPRQHAQAIHHAVRRNGRFSGEALFNTHPPVGSRADPRTLAMAPRRNATGRNRPHNVVNVLFKRSVVVGVLHNAGGLISRNGCSFLSTSAARSRS